MAWLPDGEKISKISLFVLAQLTNVTDTRTDIGAGTVWDVWDSSHTDFVACGTSMHSSHTDFWACTFVYHIE